MRTRPAKQDADQAEASAAPGLSRTSRAGRRSRRSYSADPNPGERLSYLREAAGYTTEEFAKALAISRSWLHQMEAGDKVDDLNFRRQLAQTLTVPQSTLEGFLDDPWSTRHLTEEDWAQAAQLAAKVRLVGMLYGRRAIERAAQLLNCLELWLAFGDGTSTAQGNLVADLAFNRWEQATNAVAGLAQRRISITSSTTHEVYSVLLQAAGRGQTIRATSAVKLDWWTRQREGRDYHALNLMKAGIDEVSIYRLLIWPTEEYLITEQLLSGKRDKAHVAHLGEFIANIIIPQMRTTRIFFKQIIWQEVPPPLKKDMIVVDDACAAWADLQEVSEPNEVLVSWLPTDVDSNGRAHLRAWNLARDLPDERFLKEVVDKYQELITID